MHYLKRIFHFYIFSSIHVALAVVCLILITNKIFFISNSRTLLLFAFFATVTGYNFTKYSSLFINKKKNARSLNIVLYFSVFSFIMAFFYFLNFNAYSQALICVLCVLTFLYATPVFPHKKNIRNRGGIKIYIVSFCWVGVTLVLPLLEGDVFRTPFFYVKCMQRFIFVFVLILIFEIIDLNTDHPLLKTIPQQIGVKATKILGILLLILFYILELLYSKHSFLPVHLLLCLVTGLFLLFATKKRHRYYVSFWVESIPIVWCGVLYF